MKTKLLSNGKSFTYSDEDYFTAIRYGWCYSNGYVIGRVGGKNVRFHRLVTNCPEDKHVDHIDGNPLNNCRDNLRITDRSGNMRNSSYKNVVGKTSQYKGVCLCRVTGKWKAQITAGEGTINLGRYKTELEAAKVYDLKAKELFKEFAYINGV